MEPRQREVSKKRYDQWESCKDVDRHWVVQDYCSSESDAKAPIQCVHGDVCSYPTATVKLAIGS